MSKRQDTLRREQSQASGPARRGEQGANDALCRPDRPTQAAHGQAWCCERLRQSLAGRIRPTPLRPASARPALVRAQCDYRSFEMSIEFAGALNETVSL